MIHSQYQAYISPARKIAPMGACVLKTSSPTEASSCCRDGDKNRQIRIAYNKSSGTFP
jgi:hypothetical protein